MESLQQSDDIRQQPARSLGTRHARIAVAAATAVAAAVAIVLVFTLGGPEQTTDDSVAATLRVPGHPGWVTVGDDAMWLTLNCDVPGGCETRGFARIELATGAVEKTVPLTGEPSWTVRVGDALIANRFPEGRDKPGELLRLDWKTGEILARRSLPFGPGELVWGGGALWLGHFQRNAPSAIHRIDPETLQQIGEPFPISNHMSVGLAYGDGMLWATASDDGELVRIDPKSGETARVEVGRFPVGIALAGGSVWVANRESGTVSRVDPKTMQTVGDPIEIGGNSTWIVAAAGSVWVASQNEGTVTRIDASTGEKIGSPIRIAAPSDFDGAAHAMSAVDGSIWITSLTEDTVSRIQATP